MPREQKITSYLHLLVVIKVWSAKLLVLVRGVQGYILSHKADSAWYKIKFFFSLTFTNLSFIFHYC
jgi:hypothetical protein